MRELLRKEFLYIILERSEEAREAAEIARAFHHCEIGPLCEPAFLYKAGTLHTAAHVLQVWLELFYCLERRHVVLQCGLAIQSLEFILSCD